jgi:hypothetical protein
MERFLVSPLGTALAIALLPWTAIGASAVPDSHAGGASALALVQTQFTCEQVNKIRPDDNAYKQLTSTARMILNAQWDSCEAKKNGLTPKPEDDVSIIVANPVATDNDHKVFYGTLKRRDLNSAADNCAKTGKVAGIAMQVAGPSMPDVGAAGALVYKFSGVSCDGSGR